MRTAMEMYMVMVSNTLIDKIRNRLEEYKKEYVLKIGHIQMFLTLRRNVRSDMVYFRELIETHWKLCKDNKIVPSETLEYYHRLLVGVEQKSFIQIIKMVDPWFGLSKAEVDKRNKELTALVKEFLRNENTN